MAEAPRRDARVEDREIRRVEHAVADTHQHRDRIEPEDARGGAREDRAAREQPESAQEHGTSAVAVDGEARGELGEAAAEIEDSGQRAQRREGDAEFHAQQRKHRREDKLEEMRRPVGEADQPDDFHVVTERG